MDQNKLVQFAHHIIKNSPQFNWSKIATEYLNSERKVNIFDNKEIKRAKRLAEKIEELVRRGKKKERSKQYENR